MYVHVTVVYIGRGEVRFGSLNLCGPCMGSQCEVGVVDEYSVDACLTILSSQVQLSEKLLGKEVECYTIPQKCVNNATEYVSQKCVNMNIFS